jgi:hypothetical protein
VSRRDRGYEKCTVGLDDEDAVRCAGRQQQPDCWAVVPVPCGFVRYARLTIRLLWLACIGLAAELRQVLRPSF